MISIVVPTYNEVGNIEKLIQEIDRALGVDFEYELIFVNDGSSDGSLKLLKSISENKNRIKFISFSRNFGHQAALRAGLMYATGEAVISMDADLQHPPKLLPKLIKSWRDGYDVVYTIREDTLETGAFKRMSSSGFYRVINFLSGLHIEEGAADFRLLDRKVVDVINAQQESDLFMRGYINWIGFDQLGIPYTPAKRFSGSSKYTIKKMFKLASQGVTQFSTKPLRIAHLFAGVACVFSLLYIIYAITMALSGNVIPGWLSLVTLIVFLQGVQFMLLGMMGEYIGRTFMQTKHRPEYIVADTNYKNKEKK